MWFHERLQGSFDHHLGDAVGDRGYPQRPGSPIVLRYVHPSHRRRKVAARCQPIPQLVEVVFEIRLKVRDRLSIHASRTLVGSHAFVGFPDFSFRNLKRLCSIHGVPSPVDPGPELNNAAPSLQLHYRAFITITGCSAPVPRLATLSLMGAAHLDFSRRIGATGSHVPCQSPSQSHAAFMPDAAWAAIRRKTFAKIGLIPDPCGV